MSETLYTGYLLQYTGLLVLVPPVWIGYLPLVLDILGVGPGAGRENPPR